MQRGPLLQPFAQQNSFCQGRLALEPAGCVQPSRFSQSSARTGSRTHTATGFVGLILSPLSRSAEEANPPGACHAASCALLLWGGFSSRRFLRKSLTPFPVGSPRFAPASPSAFGLTPFPQSCHGFVLAPSSRQKPRQPRVLTIKWGVGVSLQSRARQKPEPGIPAKGFLWAQLFRSRQQPFPRRRILLHAHGDFSVFCLPTSVL
jgi:hypothetical protein